MSKHDDDFWGGQAAWAERADATAFPPTSDRSLAGSDETTTPDEWSDGSSWTNDDHRPLVGLRRRWSSLLSAGTNPTREHGIVRPDAARLHDASTGHRTDSTMFDDLDDDLAADDFPDVSGDDRPISHFDAEPWDAEFAPVPIAVEPATDRGPGIDPLLARIGVIAVATALLVPLMLNGGSGDAGTLLESSAGEAIVGTQSDEAQPVTPTLFPSDSETATQDEAAAAFESATSAPLVIADLPRAVPVNTSASASQASDADVQSGQVATTAAPSSESLQDSEDSDAADGDVSSIDDVARADAPATRVAPVCAIDYVVVGGDFWIRIADGAGVELDELLEVNRATTDTPLFAGRTICLPAGSTTPPPPVATTTPPPTTQATTTTTTPTTVAPTTTVAPSPPPGADEVVQIIRDVWPDDLEERALEIAYRESRYDPNAKNFCCYGLFQIYWSVHRSWLTDMGITQSSQLYDAETNARAAYALYERAGGWGPWGS